MIDLGEWCLFFCQGASHILFQLVSSVYPFDDSSSRLYLYTILTMPLALPPLWFPRLVLFVTSTLLVGREVTGEPGAPKKNNLLAERVDIVTNVGLF